MPGKADLFTIEVIYAKPDEQVLLTLTVPKGTCIEEAIEQSGLLARFPEIAVSDLKFGVFGVQCKQGSCLQDGDRVEIYRPLIQDPKDARRQRALKK